METELLERRLIDLETRAAFQEKTIEELSDIVRKQHDQIDLLIEKFRDLGKQLQSNVSPDDPNYRPPHY